MFGRFWKRVDRVEGDCWLWTGGQSVNGYGSCLDYLAETPRTTYAHRLSWRIHRGEIPEGLQIDHLCRNKLCVNPDHLEPVTQSENLKRRSAKVQCKSGHPFTAENTYQTKAGTRCCRTCRRDAAKRFRDSHEPYHKPAIRKRQGAGWLYLQP